MDENTRAAIARYRSLPYRRRVEPRQDEGSDEWYWLAWIEEIPGLRIDGETSERALLRLDETFDDFILTQLECGIPVAEPELIWPYESPDVIASRVAEIEERYAHAVLHEAAVEELLHSIQETNEDTARLGSDELTDDNHVTRDSFHSAAA